MQTLTGLQFSRDAQDHLTFGES